MMCIKKRSFFLCFFVLLILGIAIPVESFLRADKFSISRMKPSAEIALTIELPLPSDLQIQEIQEILKQPFSYLAKGSQSYAFQSQDNRYVLKFIRYDRLRPSILDILNKTKQRIRKNRRDILQESLYLAYTRLKEETGLIYIHLNPHLSLNQKIHLTDKIGRRYLIDSDTYGFTLQKKAEPLYAALLRLKENNQHALATHYVHELFSLFAKRFEKGIVDQDPAIHKNSGFCEGKAIYIDIGQFKRKTLNADAQQQEISKMVRRFYEWSQENYSGLVEVIDKELRSV
jgi:hypothetical protein